MGWQCTSQNFWFVPESGFVMTGEEGEAFEWIGLLGTFLEMGSVSGRESISIVSSANKYMQLLI